MLDVHELKGVISAVMQKLSHGILSNEETFRDEVTAEPEEDSYIWKQGYLHKQIFFYKRF